MSSISDDDASILERSEVDGINVADFAKTIAQVPNLMNNNKDSEISLIVSDDHFTSNSSSFANAVDDNPK